jgi:hypothetical protein
MKTFTVKVTDDFAEELMEAAKWLEEQGLIPRTTRFYLTKFALKQVLAIVNKQRLKRETVQGGKKGSPH